MTPLGNLMASIEDLRVKVAEGCESVSYVTSGIFVISIFLTILRPDPTLAICLFGFYGASASSCRCSFPSSMIATSLSPGAHVRSKAAIRSFWVFLLLSVVVDGLWVVQYSALRPFTWSQVQQMTRREQVSASAAAAAITCAVGRAAVAALSVPFAAAAAAAPMACDLRCPADCGT